MPRETTSEKIFSDRGCGPELATESFRFRNLEAGHDGVGIMCKSDAVYAVGRLELTRRYERRFVIARDDFFVDRAFDLLTLDCDRDFLGHRLAHADRLVYRRVGCGD